MARNNRTVDRDERVESLLDAAEQAFLDSGYTSTTMAQIAREAGVTGPNLYWYFGSKDGALAAVQRRVQERVMERVASTETNAMARLELYLEIMRAEARPLHRMLHERASHSDAVAEVLDDVHSAIEGLIFDAVRERNAMFDETETVLALAMATIEGTNAVMSPEHSSRLLRFAIERTVPARDGSGDTDHAG